MSDSNTTDYFTPVLDADVPAKHQATVAKYRQLATEHKVSVETPVCYRVKAGFTLKGHALGIEHKGDYKHFQGWKFPDEVTREGLAFWMPRLLNDSTSKTKDEQDKLLADLRQKMELPAHHLNGFGAIGLLAGLIITYYRATGERLPPAGDIVRTDTLSDGTRLHLGGFERDGLHFGEWHLDHTPRSFLGVFAIGVEPL